jgi:hypothetical protein
LEGRLDDSWAGCGLRFMTSVASFCSFSLFFGWLLLKEEEEREGKQRRIEQKKWRMFKTIQRR